MKRFLFLLIYLGFFTATSGATVYLHKCMGKIVEWNFYHNNEKQCDRCGMEKKESSDSKDCCSVQAKTFKTQADVPFQSVLKQWENATQALPVHFNSRIFFSYNYLHFKDYSSLEFVPPGAPSFRILNGVFLI